MKLQIEKVYNGYIITSIDEASECNKTMVVQEDIHDYTESNAELDLVTFNKLVDILQDEFAVYNSKHNKIAFINGVCSCDKRWDIKEQMESSLKTPKNDYGD